MREESSTKRMEAIAAMNEGLSAFLAASKKHFTTEFVARVSNWTTCVVVLSVPLLPGVKCWLVS